MPRWLGEHIEGRLGSVDAELVTEIRRSIRTPNSARDPVDPAPGSEVHVDEAVFVMRILLGRRA